MPELALVESLEQSVSKIIKHGSRYLRSKTSLLRAVEMLLALHGCARRAAAYSTSLQRHTFMCLPVVDEAALRILEVTSTT